VKISKTEYAVFVYYKLESKYKKISKFEEVMVQNQKKMSDFKWNASGREKPEKIRKRPREPSFL
jgi:hypothetical protein